VQVYPREGKKAQGFTIRIKHNGRGVKIHDRGNLTKREIQAIVMHFTSDDTILKILNDRYKEMKEIVKELLC
jgi:hypothetical protein